MTYVFNTKSGNVRTVRVMFFRAITPPERSGRVLNAPDSMARTAFVSSASLVALVACVPPGSSGRFDGGTTGAANAPAVRPSLNVMTAPFEDAFERANIGAPVAPGAPGSPVAPGAPGASAVPPLFGATSFDASA